MAASTFKKIARSILNDEHIAWFVKAADDKLTSLGNLSRNAILRKLVNKHVEKGNLLRASEVEGMRTAEQAGRLLAKEKISPNAVMDGGGYLSTVSIPGIRNRKVALDTLKWAEGKGNIGEFATKKLPTDFKTRFGVSQNGDINMPKLIKQKKYGILNNFGAFEQGFGASYNAAADKTYNNAKNPLLRGMQQALGADPTSLNTKNNIFKMQNKAFGGQSPEITTNDYI